MVQCTSIPNIHANVFIPSDFVTCLVAFLWKNIKFTYIIYWKWNPLAYCMVPVLILPEKEGKWKTDESNWLETPLAGFWYSAVEGLVVWPLMTWFLTLAEPTQQPTSKHCFIQKLQWCQLCFCVMLEARGEGETEFCQTLKENRIVNCNRKRLS